jgi:hypothetical protein
MEFLVEFEIHVPDGTSEVEVKDRTNAEATASAKLATRSQLADSTSGSAGKVFRAFGGEVPGENTGGLAHFDQITVWIPHVAADLCSAVYRRRKKAGTAIAPLSVAGVDVGDAEVEEDGGGVARLVVDDGDVRLVGSGWSARVH